MTGLCTAGDNLVITPGAGSLAGNEVPTLCGTLTGQHGNLFKIASFFQQIKFQGYQSYSNFTFLSLPIKYILMRALVLQVQPLH